MQDISFLSIAIGAIAGWIFKSSLGTHAGTRKAYHAERSKHLLEFRHVLFSLSNDIGSALAALPSAPTMPGKAPKRRIIGPEGLVEHWWVVKMMKRTDFPVYPPPELGWSKLRSDLPLALAESIENVYEEMIAHSAFFSSSTGIGRNGPIPESSSVKFTDVETYYQELAKTHSKIKSALKIVDRHFGITHQRGIAAVPTMLLSAYHWAFSDFYDEVVATFRNKHD